VTHTRNFQDGLLHRVKELRGRLSSEVNADRLPGSEAGESFQSTAGEGARPTIVADA
jgi:hypothetical protein